MNSNPGDQPSQIVVGSGGPAAGPGSFWHGLRERLHHLHPTHKTIIAVSCAGLVLLLVGIALVLFFGMKEAPTAKKAAEQAAEKIAQEAAEDTPAEEPDDTPAPTPSQGQPQQGGSSSPPASGGGSTGGSGGSSGSSGGSTSSCALPKYPTASCTGVPSGWTPVTTINGNLTITTNGAVIENYLVTGMIDVRANNVTIRKTRTYGGIDNFVTNVVYGPLLIEDSEVVLPPGQTESWDYGHVFGVANYTCRRCKVVGRAEGWRVGASGYAGAGPVTIEDSYAKLQVTQAQCDADDPHGDGIQGYGGPFVTIRHNTIDQRDDPCPTSPIFIPSGQGNDGGDIIDNVLAGGGFTLRAYGGNFPSITGNKIVYNTWAYGPLDINCSLIGNWSGNATVNFNWTTGEIISQVSPLNDC
jgi:hypothetical protein